jgi:hypothetical protein
VVLSGRGSVGSHLRLIDDADVSSHGAGAQYPIRVPLLVLVGMAGALIITSIDVRVGTLTPLLAGVLPHVPHNLASPAGTVLCYQPVFLGIWRSDRRAA